MTIIGFSFACSKDNSLERKIAKRDGVWNIDEVSWTIVSQSGSGQSVTNGTTQNAGTFTFDKSSGKYSYTVNGTKRSGTFSWSVTDGKVSLTSVRQSIDFSSGGLTQYSVAYSGTDVSKSKMVIEGSETDQEVGSSINQFVLTGTFTLSKK